MIQNRQFNHLRNSAEKDFKIVTRNTKWYSLLAIPDAVVGGVLTGKGQPWGLKDSEF